MSFPSDAKTHQYDGTTTNFSANHLKPTIPMYLRVTAGKQYRVRINTGSNTVIFGYTLSLMAIGEDTRPNYKPSGTTSSMMCSATGTYPGASSMDSGDIATIAFPKTKYINLYAHCTSLSDGGEQCDVDVDHEGNEYWTRVMSVQIDNEPKPPTLSAPYASSVSRNGATITASWSKQDYSDAYITYGYSSASSDTPTWITGSTVTGLSPLTTYKCWAKVTYSGGTVGPLSGTFTTPGNTPSITGISVTDLQGQSATVAASGFAKGDYSDAVVQYRFIRNAGQSYSWDTGWGANPTQGLQRGIWYTAYARAHCSAGDYTEKSVVFRTYGITRSNESASWSGFSCTLAEVEGRGTIDWTISCTGGQASTRDDVTKSASGTGSVSASLYPGTYRLSYNVRGKTNTDYTYDFTVPVVTCSSISLSSKTVNGTSTTAILSCTSSNVIEDLTATITATATDGSGSKSATATFKNTSASDRHNSKNTGIVTITGLTNGKDYTITGSVVGTISSSATAGNTQSVRTYKVDITKDLIKTKQYNQKFTVTAGAINGTDQPAATGVQFALRDTTVSDSYADGTYVNYHTVSGLTPGASYTINFNCIGTVTQNTYTVSLTDVINSSSVTLYQAPNSADIKSFLTRYSGTTLTIYGTCTQYCPTNTITKFEFIPTKQDGTSVPILSSTANIFTNDEHTAIETPLVKFTDLNNGDLLTFNLRVTDSENNIIETTATKTTGMTNKIVLTLVKAKTHQFTVKATVTKDPNNPDEDMYNRIRIIFRRINAADSEFNRTAFGVTNYDGMDYAVYYKDERYIRLLRGVEYDYDEKALVFTSSTAYKYFVNRKSVTEYTNPFALPHNAPVEFSNMDPYNRDLVFEENSYYQALAYIDNIFVNDPDSKTMENEYEDTFTWLNMKTAMSFKNLDFDAVATGTTITIDVKWDQNDAEGVVATAKVFESAGDTTPIDTLNTIPDDQETDLLSVGRTKGHTYTIKVTATDSDGYTCDDVEIVKTITTYRVKYTPDVINVVSTKTIRFNLSIIAGADRTKPLKYIISDAITENDIDDSTGAAYTPLASDRQYNQDTGLLHNHTYTVFGWIDDMHDQNGKLDTIEAIQVTTQQLMLEYVESTSVNQHNVITKWQSYAGQPSSRDVYDEDPLTGDDITFYISECNATPKAESGYQTWNTAKQLYALGGYLPNSTTLGYYIGSSQASKDKQLTSKVPTSADTRYGELGYYGAYTIKATVFDGVNKATKSVVVHTEFPYTYIFTDVGNAPGQAKRYKKAIPYVYTNGTWKKAPVFISTGQDADNQAWKVSNGDDFVQDAPDFVTGR